MIANVGEAAVSGVSLVDNIMVLFINVFAALATGGAVIAGQYLGQKRTEQACRAATQIVWFILLISLAIMALIYFGKGFILNVVFGHIDADVMHHADVYLMMIVTASIPFIALSMRARRFSGRWEIQSVDAGVGFDEHHQCVRKCVLIYGFHRGAEVLRSRRSYHGWWGICGHWTVYRIRNCWYILTGRSVIARMVG